MEIQDLREELDRRFDRLEEKLDKYNELTIKNTNDIKWVKGSVKWSLSAILAIITSLLGYFTGGK